MNKSSLGYFLLITALFLGVVNYSPFLQTPILDAMNSIKKTYHQTVQYINTSIDAHFLQAQTIKNLTQKLQNCEQDHLLMQQLTHEVDDLYKLSKSRFSNHPKVQLVRTIAYEQFGNMNRLWLDVPEYNSSKIYGLVYKEQVAGIVINKNGRALALLNHDIKSAYSVYIGGKKAPGIAHGNNEQNIIVNFIPAWFEIKVGDEVITSGLDHVFFKGLKVGKVLSVNESQGYQNAVVKPYYNDNEPHYFYMIKDVR